MYQLRCRCLAWLDAIGKLFYDECGEFRPAIAQERTEAMQRDLNHAYYIHGDGGIQVVQARLAEHGLCSRTYWVPGPPRWQFHYETYLNRHQIEELLSDVWNRFDLRLDEAR